MRFVSAFGVALVLGAALVCSASGAPKVTVHDGAGKKIVAEPAPEFVTVPDVAHGMTLTAETFGRRQEPPKKEGLHKIGSVPAKFAFAAGGVVLGIVWLVLKVLLVIVLVLVVVYYIRNRRAVRASGEDVDRVDSLAAAFDQAVHAVRTKRQELQAKVGILDKRVETITPAKAKPRKRKTTRARKSSAK